MTDISLELRPALAGTAAYGDLVMRSGQLVLTSDADPTGTNPVLQDIVTRLRCFAGEWYLDSTIGTPWYQELLGQKTPPPTLDAVLQSVVLNTPGVLQLTDWRASLDGTRRTLSIAFAAVTTLGDISYVAPLTLTNS